MPTVHDDSGEITIESILGQMGFGRSPNTTMPKGDPRKQRILMGLSYVTEGIAWILLFVSFISLAIAVVGIFSLATFGSFLNLGVINAAALVVAGALGTSSIVSAATSVRRVGQDARIPPDLKRIMEAAGIRL